jgi:hypothetical protein
MRAGGVPRYHAPSSTIRCAAGLAGFLTLIQLRTRPLRYGRSQRLETMPSKPILPLVKRCSGKTLIVRHAPALSPCCRAT